jgi:hypothetical protein
VVADIHKSLATEKANDAHRVRAEEARLQQRLTGLKQADEPSQLLTASRTLELANKAYSLYVRQNPTEQAKLLKIVLSNCKIDPVSIEPTYRKPFDLIFARAKNCPA